MRFMKLLQSEKIIMLNISYQDYAKATVKEFLGIYGYEEDVDINMDDSETQKASETSTNTSQTTDKQTESTTTTSKNF